MVLWHSSSSCIEHASIPLHPQLPQLAQRDGTTSQLCTHLLGEQHLPPDRFLSGPYPRPHPCNSRPDTPTGLSLLLKPPSSAVPENAQRILMQVQELLAMVQERLSKDEAGNILDQRVHVVATTQELRHSTQNLVWLTRD